jgi:quercetin 2,3-dioxygenase
VIEVLRAAERATGGYAGMSTASHLRFVPGQGAGVGPLVICDDCLLPPGTRFPMHPHHDDETISYVRSGTLYGKDDSGTELALSPGSVGVMSAGRGMQHEEWVPDDGEPVRMYHVAVWPREAGLEPRYVAREPDAQRRDTLRLIASGDGRDGSLSIHQDLEVYDAELSAGGRVEHQMKGGRIVWLTVPRGSVRVDGTALDEGDSATIREVRSIEVVAESDAELLLFDVDPDAPAYGGGTRFGGS